MFDIKGSANTDEDEGSHRRNLRQKAVEALRCIQRLLRRMAWDLKVDDLPLDWKDWIAKLSSAIDDAANEEKKTPDLERSGNDTDEAHAALKGAMQDAEIMRKALAEKGASEPKK